MAGKSCDNCGKVYNKYLGDRFWSGKYLVKGEKMDFLCNSCYREHIRNK